jgi:hypothetical protein
MENNMSKSTTVEIHSGISTPQNPTRGAFAALGRQPKNSL